MSCDLENASELLTAADVASRLKVHKCTILKMTGLPSVYVGSRRRFEWGSVLRFIASRQRPSR